MAPSLSRFSHVLLTALITLAGMVISPAQTTPSQNTPAKSEPDGVPAPDKSPNFAFLCLNSNTDPKSDVLKSKLVVWLKLDSADRLTKFQIARKKEAIITSFVVDSKSVTLARVDSPIPKEDIDYACANSTLWPQAAEKLAGHKGHLNVSVFGKFEDAIDLALFVSRVMAACTEAYDTAGIYWGHATTVHSPEFFREQIEESNRVDLPIHVWIGFLQSAGKKEGTFDLYTRGLDAFSVMEIEIIGMKGKPTDIIGMVAELSDHLLKHGNVIKDGHTIESPNGGKIGIHHANSALAREGKVLRIEF